MAVELKVIIQLRDGCIHAVQREGLVIARGVKYAEARRFEAPRPSQKWDDIIDCTKPATICPQLPSRLEMINGPIAARRTMDEACLHVSVFSPSLSHSKDDGLIPVMVFLHGGGYSSGAGDLDCYSGAPLASMGVVVVNITYRLGIFGYQPIEGIAPPNLGLLDQIAALRWVQDNIQCFGGDPKRVCLFGESAGADSIFCLLGSDDVEGLFHRVILQSAPWAFRYMDQDSRHKMIEALSSMAGDLLPRNHDTASIEELLRVQQRLMIAATSFPMAVIPFGPIIGHYPLPQKSEFDGRLESAIHRVPIFIGYTKDEGRAFEGMFNQMKPRPVIPVGKTVASFISKHWFQDPAEQFFRRIMDAGRQPWFYVFSLAPDQNQFGAIHTIDMPFLLGTWDNWKEAPMMSGRNTQELVERVGSEVKKLWVAFAEGRNSGTAQFVIDEHFTFHK
ncbi:carboxylesterase type B active site protein [Penicillium macrosclerotiorum]|uniref:carboxylesterase type B active site protein n=1 Tax=Penicillium macrosclerotiorum TaxID=303699 RepID=UPI002548AD6C|nr:carboxylesterase type B active site protein [Penicillium macrosclerotiorum]KAJ5689105.1 carboxylesterase type B active site protein [Penicillium macrosclerotiorum]